MAVQRDRPYANFNFLVDLGTGEPAGFSEVDLGEARIGVIAYREGDDKENEERKLPGRPHVGNVVLRRGIGGRLDLYQWWNDVRNGNTNAMRTVTVQLLNEERSDVVMTWKLLRAWPVALKYGPLRGLGEEVALETLELAYERLELE